MTKLKVAEAREEDVFEDIVRINFRYRQDKAGQTIPSGAVCRISVGHKSARAIVRGLPAEEGPLIRLDESLRRVIGVKSGDEIEIVLKRAGFFEEVVWCWQATNPTYRISARLAVLSVLLGLIGLVLGVISLCLTGK